MDLWSTIPGLARGGGRSPPLFGPPLNWKFCATPKICKKLFCSSKIVDFTAVFRNFLAAQTNGTKKCIIYFWKVNYMSHFILKYLLFNITISLWNSIHNYIWKCRETHTHFFNLAPPPFSNPLARPATLCSPWSAFFKSYIFSVLTIYSMINNTNFIISHKGHFDIC